MDLILIHLSCFNLTITIDPIEATIDQLAIIKSLS